MNFRSPWTCTERGCPWDGGLWFFPIDGVGADTEQVRLSAASASWKANRQSIINSPRAPILVLTSKANIYFSPRNASLISVPAKAGSAALNRRVRFQENSDWVSCSVLKADADNSASIFLRLSMRRQKNTDVLARTAIRGANVGLLFSVTLGVPDRPRCLTKQLIDRLSRRDARRANLHRLVGVHPATTQEIATLGRFGRR